MFEQIDNSQCLPVMLESAEFSHQMVEGFFAGVSEGRVSQIMCQAYCLGKVNIELKYFCDGPSYLCHFDAVGKACAVIVVKARREDLRFAFQPAKGRAVDYTVAVALKVAAIRMRLFCEFRPRL